MASEINQREYCHLNNNPNAMFRSPHYMHGVCLYCDS